MSIPEGLKKIKAGMVSKEGIDIALILIIILTALGSFGLGRLSADAGKGDPVIIDRTKINGVVDIGTGESEEGMRGSGYVSSSSLSSKAVKSIGNENTGGASTKLIVASKRGKKYYFTWCSGAKNLSEANKIYFNTEEEATRAGYSKSTSCK